MYNFKIGNTFKSRNLIFLILYVDFIIFFKNQIFKRRSNLKYYISNISFSEHIPFILVICYLLYIVQATAEIPYSFTVELPGVSFSFSLISCLRERWREKKEEKEKEREGKERKKKENEIKKKERE